MSNNISTAVDRLGVIAAQLAALKNEQAELKAVLVEHGGGVFEGDLYRATISYSERETLDIDAVREKLSPQFVRAHTRVTEVETLKVVARVGKIKVPA